MLHPAGWIGECAATMLSYKGRRGPRMLGKWRLYEPGYQGMDLEYTGSRATVGSI